MLKRVLYASSSEVYGEPIKNPINENYKLDGKSIYAISKILGEEIIKKFVKKIITQFLGFLIQLEKHR